MAEIIRKPEAGSGLSKQLLANFQTRNSCDQAEVKNGVAYQKTCIAMTELIKSISISMELHAFL